MKKWIAAVLAAVLAFALAACGQKNAEKVETGTTEGEKTVGAWEITESPTVTEELRDLVEKAQEGLTGARYVPVACLASQVVAGKNCAVLCRMTHVTADPTETYALVILYQDPDGNVTFSDVRDFGAETCLYEGNLTGGWTQPDTPEITEQAGAAFEKAMEGFTGVNYVPVALLSTQLVAGTNYRFACQARTVEPDAEASWALVTVYQDLQGGAEITEIVWLPEGENAED